MSLTDFFIKRPVFATALNLIVLLIGLVAFANLNVRQYPMIETSVITVSTNYPGASADLMSGFVTTPLENFIGQINHLDYLESYSSQGRSEIIANLDLGADPDNALTNIQAQVSQALYKMPEDVQSPVIQKADVTASPALIISFLTEDMSSEQVTDYLLRSVKPQIDAIQGVQEARIFGRREYAMRLNLSAEKMAAYSVTPEDVEQALERQNVQAAAGTIHGQEMEYDIVAATDMHTEAEFNDMLLGKNGDRLIYLKDVGRAQLGSLDYETQVRVNDRPSVSIGVIPLSTANPLQVSNDVLAVLPVIQKQLPAGMTAKVVMDNSKFIRASIHEVIKTIIEAVIFVIIVMILFIGSLRSVVIPVATIPLSIIGACSVMLILGYSINTITLLAWVLAIGLVVDDAIVVVENIHRYIQQGLSPMAAALKGTREIAFAVVAMTLTLAAVYAPIGFTGGLTGKLFSEFAFTLSASVIVSGLVALTLSPVMCSKILSSKESRFSHWLDARFERLVRGYQKLLTGCLKFRVLIVAFMVLFLVLGAVVLMLLPSTLAPQEDQGMIYTYSEGPANATLNYTQRFTQQTENIAKTVPEIESRVIIDGVPGGPNTSLSRLVLSDWSERTRSAAEINQQIRQPLQDNPGLDVFSFLPSPLPGAGSLPLEVVLKTTASNATQLLNSASQVLIRLSQRYPGIAQLNASLMLDKAQLRININRELAYVSGVDMEAISAALNVMFGRPQNSQFSLNDRSYYVIPELDQNFLYRNNPDSIKYLYVRGEADQLMPLSNFVNIETEVAPRELNHFQQLPSVTLQGTLSNGYSMGEVLDYIESVVATELPSSIQLDYAGEARQFKQSTGAMQQAFVFALIFIFLVLAAQFESFRAPLIVMTTVPLSLTGALLALYWCGGSLNIYSIIGLITLIGLISKHGILIVEFANQLRCQQPLSRHAAVLQAAGMRLRPILMTTAAMVFGALPLALSSGAGAISRSQMGWVIVGGMVSGTLFSLIVVPAIYTLLAPKTQHNPESLPETT